jgi:uncharacterized lipoprotein YajG
MSKNLNTEIKIVWLILLAIIATAILAGCSTAKQIEIVQNKVTLLSSDLKDSIINDFRKSGSPLKSAFIRNDTLFINQEP